MATPNPQTAPPAALPLRNWLDQAAPLLGADGLNAGRTALERREIPGPREERWRYLNLARLQLDAGWTPAFDTGQPTPAGKISGDGLRVLDLAQARQALPQVVDAHLGRLACRLDENPFTAFNTASAPAGLLVHVAAGTQVADPLELHQLATIANGVTLPRLLIVLEPGASLTLVERWRSETAAPTLAIAVTEIIIGADARLDHVRIEEESTAALRFQTTEVSLDGEAARYEAVSIQLGGSLVRHDLNAALRAPRSHASLNALVLTDGERVLDNHTRIEHLTPDATSHELYKTLLAGKGRSIFNGRIYVAQVAQRTDSYQSNPNLLLSRDAVANSNPELEIYADDVRCSHGATYGTLEDEPLFYLRSRGLDRDAAEAMLIQAFAGEVGAMIPVETLRNEVEEALFSRLGRARRISA